MRKSGILLPVFSLPSRYGYGDLYEGAFEFIDRLKEAGQSYWQVLPICPVNRDLCPYQSSSSFAGEPLLISLDRLAEEGLLSQEEREKVAGGSTLGDQLRLRREALGSSFGKFMKKMKADRQIEDHFMGFCDVEGFWLEDYALYEALKDRFGSGDWSTWDETIRNREPDAMDAWRDELSDDILYHKWTQYVFFTQWDELRKYARQKGVSLIGDIPYFAAHESADCWSNPDLFQLNDQGICEFVGGAPPDAFTSDGQCWGNPIYDWDANREEGFRWWIDRMHQQLRFFDQVRIDHMRGFESYYAIPADSEDPREGHWEKGPAMELFNALKEKTGTPRFIAEDLGYLTEEVREMMRETGYPGMKILQFAFDTGEENTYLPFNYETDNSVIYTGTHDNDTTLGWYEKAEEWKKRFASWYLREKSQLPLWRKEELLGGCEGDEILDPRAAVMGLVELAHSSRCETCIIPMQDYLLLGSQARINVPGVSRGNWRWQMEAGAFDEKLAATIREVTARYERL